MQTGEKPHAPQIHHMPQYVYDASLMQLNNINAVRQGVSPEHVHKHEAVNYKREVSSTQKCHQCKSELIDLALHHVLLLNQHAQNLIQRTMRNSEDSPM